MKALVIFNPQSGNGERHDVRDALSRHFGAVGIDYEIHESRTSDQITEVVRRRLSDGFDLVVAAGGDGTVSAVSDGLSGNSIPLGIIPIGTGNVLARELKIPTEMERAVALIARTPRLKKIDAMRIGQRTYLLNVGVGISASVVSGTTRKSKSRFGRIAYVGTAVLKVLACKPRRLVVEADGKAHRYRAVEVAILNCGLLSKITYPSGPEIRPDDGRLGVWILSMKTIWGHLRYTIGLAAGWTKQPDAHFIQVEKTVCIRSNVPLAVQADGDIIGTTPVSVTVVPSARTVLVPHETDD